VSIKAFIERRLGLSELGRKALDEPIPGGARFVYAPGSALTLLFTLQLITGMALAAFYSPSVTSAWASLDYLERAVPGGALLRALHHFGASTLVIFLLAHLLQTSLFGAQRPPREVTWWSGLALGALMLGFCLTGYLLPWDQKGYWATRVATGIAGSVPVIGSWLEGVLQGGNGYGNLTLTRFYAIHALWLPALVVGLIALHLWAFRRNGVTPFRISSTTWSVGEGQGGGSTSSPRDGAPIGRFWPEQLWRNALVYVLTLSVLLVLAARSGAPLSAPADPAGQFVARPEWYFLPLYQLLKYTEGSAQWIGTLLIPGLAALLLLGLPYLRRAVGFGLVCALLLAALVLGLLALREDARDPRLRLAQRRDAEEAALARKLAASGVPAAGPEVMLQSDPLFRGRKVFSARCAKCHEPSQGEPRKAPDLDGYLSQEWLVALLRNPDDPRFFGGTKANGQMEGYAELGEERLGRLATFLRNGADRKDPDGRKLFGASGCESCHSLEPSEANIGPNLAGYGSAAWLAAFLDAPGSDLFYGETNTMPDFRTRLTAEEKDAVIAYLRSLSAGASP
jgi:ubiquinol-cytochrome c reductase cytochrome b subunit